MKERTKESSAGNNIDNNNEYKSITVRLPKDLVSEFKEKCKAEGVSQAQIFKTAIEIYIKQH